MASAIGSVSSPAQSQAVQAAALQQVKQDRDGDNDGSKAGEVEKNEANKGPVSATVGNNINTTA